MTGSADGTVTVTDNPGASRYEIHRDGAVAGFAAYRQEGNRVVFTHTEVQPAHEGRGLGSRLVQGALDDVRAGRRSAVPQCPFVAAWVREHPAYADLIS